MKKQTEQHIECTLFGTAFNTLAYTPLMLEAYLADVVSGKYQQQVANVRNHVAAGRTAEAAACKKKLSLLVVGGRMEGGRKRQHLVSYSGCLVADIDHVSGSPLELLGRAGKLPYVKAGHISPSGTGIKLFVLVDSDIDHHAEAFSVVCRLLESDLPGVQVDPSGKDPNRGCFVSHDPAAFYKEVAQVVGVPVGTDRADRQAQGQLHALSNYIDKFETGHPFADGGRHSYVVKLASALNSAGFGEAEVVAECLFRYAGSGFGEKEILTTVSDVYRRYRSAHGSTVFGPKKGVSQGENPTYPKNPTPSLGGSPFEEELLEGSDCETVEGDFPHFDKGILKALPPLLADAVKIATDETEHDLILLAALTMISTTLPHVKGLLRKTFFYAPLYTVVIGPSGSGKGCVSQVHKMVMPWQQSVYEKSAREVAAYIQKKEAYEMSRQLQRGKKAKEMPEAPLEAPPLVEQRQLHLGGYTTTARMISQLKINAPYASLLFETELESLNNTMGQDFGGYGYVLNQAFHGERISCASKSNGTWLVDNPKLGMFVTGTPNMFAKFVPSTENGLFSRLMIYRITGGAVYRGLTADDDDPQTASYYSVLGERLKEMAEFLDTSKTFVHFTDRQRKVLDRYFKREYDNVRVFGNDDVASVVLRHILMIFRVAMVLTGLRKAEAREDRYDWVISDEDFEIAFHIGQVSLRHAMMVSTTLKHGEAEAGFKKNTPQFDLFAALPCIY